MPDELKGAIQELTGLVREIAQAQSESQNALNEIKEKTEKHEAVIATYQETVQRRFPIPKGPGTTPATMTEEDNEFLKNVDMAVQGQRLMDKIHHPIFQLPEEKRLELTKFFILFLKASVMQDWTAKQEFRRVFGEFKLTVDVGDPGNVFPVPDELMNIILGFAREKSVMLRLGRVWNMTSEVMSFPAETANSASVQWGNETEEGTPEIGEVELTAEELSAFSSVKNTTLADAQVDITSWLAEVMAEAAAMEIDNQAFNGDGTKAGGCYGILSNQCGNTCYMGGASDSGSTSFADLVYSDLSAMLTKLPGLRKAGARFFMSGDLLHYVRLLKDKNDRPIFIEMPGLGVPGTILGYPYEEVVKMPTVDAVSTACIAFGNPQYFAVGRRLGSVALSANPYDQWKRNRTLFKIYQRWALRMAVEAAFVRLLTSAT